MLTLTGLLRNKDEDVESHVPHSQQHAAHDAREFQLVLHPAAF